MNTAWAQAGGKKAKKDAAKSAAKAVTPAVQIVVPATGKKVDALQLAKIIDEQIQKRLDADGVKASPKTDDAEFLRRVYLDVVGVIPTPEKVKEFLDSKDPDKRRKVIEDLLADPRFGSALGEAWSGLMIPRESNNRFLNYGPLQQWLAEKFNSNTPLDKTVFELLTAAGPLEENPAGTYFVGNPTVDKMTDNVTRMFLGVQLQCAQCHNHPFTDWKQTEYWAMAAFFMKTRLTATPQQAAKKGKQVSVLETTAAKGKKGNVPESAKFVPAKFLQGESPKLDTSEPYRPVLANWIASPNNPFFAKAMVNRFWYQLFGRGLVNPVDDMHDENPASHPALLAALTEQFKTNNFDLKYLYRAILNSEAYQRTSRPNESNKDDKELFSRAQVRVLSPEQLFDSLASVVGRQNLAKAVATNKAVAAKKGPGGGREQFLAFFRIDEGADPLEYQHGIPQALRLMNSPQLTNSAQAINDATKDGGQPAQVIERLYLAALSRLPAAEEVQRMTQYVQRTGDARTAYSDILWALLNSSEFALNH